MEKLITLVLIICITSFQCSSQTSDNIDFLFDQSLVSQISTIENKNRSTQIALESEVFLSSDYFPDADNPLISPYPLTYIRADKNFEPVPKVEVMYFFTENDSTIKLVTYSWDPIEINSELADINSNLWNRLPEFEEKYNSIQNQLNITLGNPVKSDSEIKKMTKNGYGQWLEKSAKWSKNKTTVELKMIFTQDKDKLGTHRIRIKIYWEK